MSDTPVFRMYNPYAGERHYTMKSDEKDAMISVGWEDEGIGWYSDDAETVPLFREYNPNEPADNHNYTTDKAEHDSLVAAGWVDEGYAWYGMQYTRRSLTPSNGNAHGRKERMRSGHADKHDEMPALRRSRQPHRSL